jgi:hypothetical protein
MPPQCLSRHTINLIPRPTVQLKQTTVCSPLGSACVSVCLYVLLSAAAKRECSAGRRRRPLGEQSRQSGQLIVLNARRPPPTIGAGQLRQAAPSEGQYDVAERVMYDAGGVARGTRNSFQQCGSAPKRTTATRSTTTTTTTSTTTTTAALASDLIYRPLTSWSALAAAT